MLMLSSFSSNELAELCCLNDIICFGVFSGIVSIQVSNTVSNQPAILGGSVTLQCSFTLVTATEAASASILLKRKRQGDSGFSTIVSIPFSTFDRFNASYIDTSLESRTVATNPENSESSSVSFRFNNVECRDVAQYQWVVNYNTGIDQKEERTSDVTVKGKTPKYSGTRKIDVIILKFEQNGFTIK